MDLYYLFIYALVLCFAGVTQQSPAWLREVHGHITIVLFITLAMKVIHVHCGMVLAIPLYYIIWYENPEFLLTCVQAVLNATMSHNYWRDGEDGEW